jgi:hypothetical protein
MSCQQEEAQHIGLESCSPQELTKKSTKKSGILFSFWWQIWKERNRRMFDQKEASVLQVSSLIHEAIQLQGLAWNRS